MIQRIAPKLIRVQELNLKFVLGCIFVGLSVLVAILTGGHPFSSLFFFPAIISVVGGAIWTISVKGKLTTAVDQVKVIKDLYFDAAQLVNYTLTDFIKQSPSQLSDLARSCLDRKKQEILTEEQSSPNVPVDPERLKTLNEYVRAHTVFRELDLLSPVIAKVYLAEPQTQPVAAPTVNN
jgi:hypothetical protein